MSIPIMVVGLKLVAFIWIFEFGILSKLDEAREGYFEVVKRAQNKSHFSKPLVNVGGSFGFLLEIGISQPSVPAV